MLTFDQLEQLIRKNHESFIRERLREKSTIETIKERLMKTELKEWQFDDYIQKVEKEQGEVKKEVRSDGTTGYYLVKKKLIGWADHKKDKYFIQGKI